MYFSNIIWFPSTIALVICFGVSGQCVWPHPGPGTKTGGGRLPHWFSHPVNFMHRSNKLSQIKKVPPKKGLIESWLTRFVCWFYWRGVVVTSHHLRCLFVLRDNIGESRCFQESKGWIISLFSHVSRRASGESTALGARSWELPLDHIGTWLNSQSL